MKDDGPTAYNIRQVLGEQGPLAEHIPGFAPREAQQQMAEYVAKALATNKILISEAGTGTGKTFAYLAPVLLSDKKVIISTGTKNLQDQLFHRDLPTIRKSLAIPLKVALLKGRSNYLCLYRLESCAPDSFSYGKQTLADHSTIQDWSSTTTDGDVTSISSVSDDSPVWPWVTSTVDNCLGQECPHIEDCFIVKARRRAQKADILVINHHLFFSDLALRNDGLGELLPDYDAIIFDEAHQLPEIATQFLGLSISSRQLSYLARDAKQEALSHAKDMKAIFDCADQLDKTIKDTRLAFAVQSTRAAWLEASADKKLQTCLTQLKQALCDIKDVLELAAERSKGLESCWQRSEALSTNLQQLTAIAPADQIHWYETFKKSFTFHFTPLSIATPFRDYMQQQPRGFVFTSATLAVNHKFDHFAERLGINNYDSQLLASPFDYKQQARLYFPRNMPNPNDFLYVEKLLKAALPLIEASGGRTFFLFTSYRALQFAAKWLATQVDYPLLIQGDLPKTELLQRFCQTDHSVLLGTSSFWEGVDVRGDKLVLVIIDKLPFASPGDPILKARCHALKQQGKQPFYDYQLPQAVIALKQGAGRLIRDHRDRGVLMIADPRLIGRDYGKLFMQALPNMQRTRSEHQVIEFLKSCENTHEIISD